MVIKRRIYQIASLWPLLIALVLLGWALFYFAAMNHPFGYFIGDHAVFYSFYASLFDLRFSLAVCIIPASIVLLGAGSIVAQNSYGQGIPRSTYISAAIGVAILIGANFFACASTIPGALSDTQFKQYNDIKIGDRIYRADLVTAENGPGASTANFELWECDSLGLICNLIHDQDVSDEIVSQAHLIADSNSVSMQINGKTVYIYMADQ